MNALPEGLTIGGKTKWKIGALLGRGSCGSVYTLELLEKTKTPVERSFVIKISKGIASRFKSKRSADNRHAETISHEHNVFKNRLSSLCGEYIPDIPLWAGKYDPPSGGTIHAEGRTYEYLVLERLHTSLTQWAPLIDGARLSMGGIAVKMLECIEKVHNEGLLHMDVKTENFMVAHPLPSVPGNNSCLCCSPLDLSKHVRLIDFGLSESYRAFWGGKFGHRKNVPSKGLIGTPLYASCHVMRNQTPSRRDDLESLGYVLLDLYLMIKSRAMECHFPWKYNISSDEEILLKKEHFFRSNGEGLMESVDGQILMSYFDVVRQLPYKKEPDYEQLKFILKKMRGGCHSAVINRSSYDDLPTSVTCISSHDMHTCTRPATCISPNASDIETEEYFDSAEEIIDEHGTDSNSVAPASEMETSHHENLIDNVICITITGGSYKGRQAYPTGKVTKHKVTVRLDSLTGKEVSILKTSVGLHIYASFDSPVSPKVGTPDASACGPSGNVEHRIIKGGVYKDRKGFFEKTTDKMVYIHLDHPNGELKRISKSNWE